MMPGRQLDAVRDLVRVGFGLQLVRLNAPCTIETFLPIGLSHVVHSDRLSRTGRMNELTVADIDAYMAEGALHGVEKHQVAWFELASIDFFCDFGLVLSPAGQNQANGLFKHVANKATAIKSFFFRNAATFVGHT